MSPQLHHQPKFREIPSIGSLDIVLTDARSDACTHGRTDGRTTRKHNAFDRNLSAGGGIMTDDVTRREKQDLKTIYVPENLCAIQIDVFTLINARTNDIVSKRRNEKFQLFSVDLFFLFILSPRDARSASAVLLS